MLIKGMTPQEIRVLQEYRRLTTETMPLSAIKAIRHPTGGGEAPALSLVAKGFLLSDETRENFRLTETAREFLSYDPKPLYEGDAAAGEAAEITE